MFRGLRVAPLIILILAASLIQAQDAPAVAHSQSSSSTAVTTSNHASETTTVTTTSALSPTLTETHAAEPLIAADKVTVSLLPLTNGPAETSNAAPIPVAVAEHAIASSTNSASTQVPHSQAAKTNENSVVETTSTTTTTTSAPHSNSDSATSTATVSTPTSTPAPVPVTPNPVPAPAPVLTSAPSSTAQTTTTILTSTETVPTLAPSEANPSPATPTAPLPTTASPPTSPVPSSAPIAIVTTTQAPPASPTTSIIPAIPASVPEPVVLPVAPPLPAPVAMPSVATAPVPAPTPVSEPVATPLPISASPLPSPVTPTVPVVTTAPTTTTVTTATTTTSTAPVAPTVPTAPIPTTTPAIPTASTTPKEPRKVPAQCVGQKRGFCPRDYVPVCGFLSNGTSITFANSCTACTFDDLVVYSQGVCQSSKTAAPPTPVIATPTAATVDDSTPTVERLTLVPPPTPGTPYAGTGITDAATGTVRPFTPQTIACADNQSRYLAVCTREYRPVCAVHLNLTKQTYSSPCIACLDGSVAYYRTTPCTATEVKESSVPATTCQRNVIPFCRLNYNPVCAYLNDGSKRTQSNGCLACIDNKVLAYRPGECPSVKSSKSRAQMCGKDANEAVLCLLEWQEVCVVLPNSSTKQYPNGCAACQVRDWTTYSTGKCQIAA